jgi:hypothetical protein
MLRFVRDGFVLTALLALGAGCGSSSSGGGNFEVSPDNGDKYALTEVGEILRNRMLNTSQPARSVADIAGYENAGPTGLNRVRTGEIVVLWGANPKEGAVDQVLAYEKKTPQSGGFALMQDGTTVKKMTPAEFQAAPKAGTIPPAGAAPPR